MPKPLFIWQESRLQLINRKRSNVIDAIWNPLQLLWCFYFFILWHVFMSIALPYNLITPINKYISHIHCGACKCKSCAAYCKDDIKTLTLPWSQSWLHWLSRSRCCLELEQWQWAAHTFSRVLLLQQDSAGGSCDLRMKLNMDTQHQQMGWVTFR